MLFQYPSFEEIKKLDRKLTEMREQYYYHHDLFSFQWWLLLALVILPWIVWTRMVDKTRLKDILLYGTIITIIIILLDDLGGELGLWSYPYQLIRLFARLSPVDLAVLPVCHMLVFQYFRSWKSFVIANVIMAFVFSFIAEPLFIWLNIYDMDNWRYIYSFPLYIAKAMFVKWLVEFIISRNIEG